MDREKSEQSEISTGETSETSETCEISVSERFAHLPCALKILEESQPALAEMVVEAFRVIASGDKIRGRELWDKAKEAASAAGLSTTRGA